MNNKASCSHVDEYKIKNGLSAYIDLNKKYVACLGSRKKKAPYFHCFFCRERRGQIHACMDGICKFIGCFTNGHMNFHAHDLEHMISMDLKFGKVFCHECGDYMYDKEFEKISNELKSESAEKAGVEVLSGDLWMERWKPLQEEMDLVKDNGGLKKIHDNSIVGLRGLVNLGDTCYMNCIVQVLVHIPLLSQYFLSDSHLCQMDDPTNCLVCEMSVLFQEFYSGNPTPYPPTRLVHLIWTHAKHLSGYKQQDAHEFFIEFLNILHKQCQGKESPDDMQHCNCIIGQIFKGFLQSETVCRECKHLFRTYEPFLDISLDLGESICEGGKGLVEQQAVSLLDCISRYTQSECLEDAKCDHCASTSKSKRLTLKSLPVVICFHLKRLERFKKNKIHVNFPEYIDMSPYMSYNNSMEQNESKEGGLPIINEDKNKMFLSAVVNHKGNKDGGHYTSYINFQNEWYRCDDASVTLASTKDALDSEGYILFYEQQRGSSRPKGL